MTTLNEFGLSDWTMNDLRSVFRRPPLENVINTSMRYSAVIGRCLREVRCPQRTIKSLFA